MQRLRMSLSRRRFGQGLGASLILAVPFQPAKALGTPRDFEVRIDGFAFAPDVLEIATGDTVVWTNDDVAPHTATALDDSWGTKRLEKGQMSRVRFQVPGTHKYHCIFHRHMTGEIRVRPSGDE